jgi:hypothetical protein
MSTQPAIHLRTLHRGKVCGSAVWNSGPMQSRRICPGPGRASAAAGLPVTISSREFFHKLLKRYAEELGL